MYRLFLTFIPRLMVHTKLGMTDATTTLAPNLVNVSVMQVVSISSLPSAIGTRTRFVDILSEEEKERASFVRDGARKA